MRIFAVSVRGARTNCGTWGVPISWNKILGQYRLYLCIGVALILFCSALVTRWAWRSAAVKGSSQRPSISSIKCLAKDQWDSLDVMLSHPEAARISPSSRTHALPKLQESIINKVSQPGTDKAKLERSNQLNEGPWLSSELLTVRFDANIEILMRKLTEILTRFDFLRSKNDQCTNKLIDVLRYPYVVYFFS